MTITTYEIRNVLRTYGNQLKRRTSLPKDGVVPIQSSSDSVDISIEARKRQVLSQFSAKLIAQVTSKNKKQDAVEGRSGRGSRANRETALSSIFDK